MRNGKRRDNCMITLGILVTNLFQEEDYFTAMAKAGLKEDVTIYLFLPSDINTIQKIVKGKSYCHKTETWVENRFPIPQFIYDRCFYENEEIFKKHSPNVTWLKSQPNISFLGCGLPNKWFVFNALKDDPVINYFLPETELLSNPNSVFSMFTKYDSLLLKPVSGSQGKGIFVLVKSGENFYLFAKKSGVPYHKQLSQNQVEQLLKKVAAKRKYLIQPYLQLTNNEQRPFDIRIFLQKNKEGKWAEIGRGIRTGKIGDYTSNLGSGGEVSSYLDWLQILPADAWQPLQQNISILLERIPIILEKQGQQLFELGLDFGFATDGRLWVLEVNSKPGRKVITTCFPYKTESLAKGPIEYCSYLSANNKMQAL